MIGGTPASEVVHPCRETAIIAIRVTVLQHALENGLRDVFGGGALAGELGKEAEERSVVAFEKLPKGVELAISDREHQIVISERMSSGFHGGRRVFNHVRRRLRTYFCEFGDHDNRATCRLSGETGVKRKGYREIWVGPPRNTPKPIPSRPLEAPEISIHRSSHDRKRRFARDNVTY